MNISKNNVLLEIANFRNQALGALMQLTENDSNGGAVSDFAQILGSKTATPSPGGELNSLADNDSAYRMMSLINQSEINFKAQYAELSQMGSSVENLEAVGERLSEIDTTSANAEIALQLQDFADQYNTWVSRFAPDIQADGVLANVQAAEVSLYELEQSVKNIFNGAAQGVDGLNDLGITIDPVDKHARFDVAKLNALLVANKTGAVSAIDEFSANFAKSADLLNTADNFIPTQLDNRSRAIQYIADNKTNLQAEFGVGKSARPTAVVAKALAAYEQAFSIA